ncbi:MAG TPA: helix-turn-helix transcriptional regulator, partial [Clostridia bacterium]|nr:helix-turn-helix transcriptional regulator [Clostridia bacterium]
MEINERLFGLLAEIKDGQRRLAERLGITDQTISAWKSRKTDPPSKYISTIAEFLNVPVEYLLTGRENVKMETGTGKTANLVSLLNKLNESGILLVTGY